MKGPETERIHSLFNAIAVDYDKLNHILSLGIDRTWRRRALGLITDMDGAGRVLDLACGTGDFSIAIAGHSGPDVTVAGVDLSEGMLEVMRQKVAAAGLSSRISMEQGDASRLCFADGTFDRVAVAFGIRNFEDRESALKEILRVLKPYGRLVILELSVPSNRALKWLYCLYFTKILPLIGGMVSGDKAAYRYLPASVLKFPGKDEWMAVMKNCGYGNVTHTSFTFGICRMYTGEKSCL